MTETENIKESIRILLSEIVDYAGLFPPSGLTMPEAVINYATYRNSNYSWMLGRFVVPVGRLGEFLETAQDFVERDKNDGAWRLSVLASEDIYETVRQIEDFNAKNAPYIICDALEVKANSSSLIEKISNAIPPNVEMFFELPLAEDLAELVSTLAIKKQNAKIRTGGVTPEAYPSAREIIRFVQTCLAANVPFKATAGLHHPLRCFKPLTYEPDAPQGMMNGFLNLFLMTGFARAGFKTNLLQELLEDEFSGGFEFEEAGVSWRKEYFLTNAQLENLRRKSIISFGSCSFEEPVADLQEIGVL
jgi:hypothetical protein